MKTIVKHMESLLNRMPFYSMKNGTETTYQLVTVKVKTRTNQFFNKI